MTTDERQPTVLEQVKARAEAIRRSAQDREDRVRAEKERVERRSRLARDQVAVLARLAGQAGLNGCPLPGGKLIISHAHSRSLWGVEHPSGQQGHLIGASQSSGTGPQLVFAAEVDEQGAEAWLTHDGERVDTDVALLMIMDLAERLAREPAPAEPEVPF